MWRKLSENHAFHHCADDPRITCKFYVLQFLAATIPYKFITFDLSAEPNKPSMTDAGFFRGTSADQDNRFANKQKKFLKGLNLSPILNTKLIMSTLR